MENRVINIIYVPTSGTASPIHFHTDSMIGVNENRTEVRAADITPFCPNHEQIKRSILVFAQFQKQKYVRIEAEGYVSQQSYISTFEYNEDGIICNNNGPQIIQHILGLDSNQFTTLLLQAEEVITNSKF